MNRILEKLCTLSVLFFCFFSNSIFGQALSTKMKESLIQIKGPRLVLKDANRPSLSADGSRVLIFSDTDHANVYDVETGKLVRSFEVATPYSGLLSEDGTAATFFLSGIQKTFDIATGKETKTRNTEVRIGGNVVSRMSVSAGGPSNTRNYSTDITRVAGPYQVVRTDKRFEQPAVMVGDIESNTVISAFKTSDGWIDRDDWTRTVMTPDARIVASTRFNFIDRTRNRTVVWAVGNQDPILSIPHYAEFLILSSDGSRLAVYVEEGIELWSIKTGKLVFFMKQPLGKPNENRGNHGDLSPDGSLLVTSRAKDVMIFDTNTGRLIARKDQSKYSGALTRSPIFSADGKTLAVGSDSEVVTIWRIEQTIAK